MKRQSKPPAQAPFRRILVATDFSQPAEWALERAALLPIAKGGRLIVAHVLAKGAAPQLHRQMENEARHSLQDIARRMESRYRRAQRRDVAVSIALRTGAPYREVIRAARTEGAELIVVGKHGCSVIRDLLMGSTARKILHHGNMPVLIVNRKPEAAYRRAAVAIELQDTARTTLELALRALDPAVREITAVHAYAAPFEGAITHENPGAYRRACRSDAVSRVRAILHSVDSGVRWNEVIRFGDPRRVIVQELAKRRTDVAVLGTHGRSGLSHFLLGSVAEYVSCSAQCDVLLARPSPFSFALP